MELIKFIIFACFIVATVQHLTPVYPRNWMHDKTKTRTTNDSASNDEEDVINDDAGREFQCGKTKHHHQSYNARSASNDWPWAAFIHLECEAKKGGKRETLRGCSGVLIGHKWLLTAAHCLYVPAELLLRCKGNEMTGTPEEGIHFLASPEHVRVTLANADLQNLPQLGIQRYIKPDKFRKAIDFENDIALLELKAPLVMDSQINRICLPSVYLAANGHAAYVLGDYGWTRGPRENNMTRPVPAPTTILREDLIVLRKSPPCPSSMLCNIQASRQTKVGDSGGPLMREAHGKWYLLGVTKGHSCQERSCFTRITPHCNWISDKTKGEVQCYGNIV